MERMEALTNYYTTHNEDARLTPKRGMVEFLTTIHYVEKYLKPGMRILEIGAGTGRYSHYFAQNGYAVDAVELMECNIEVFKTNTKDGENITVQQGDAVDLQNIASDQYDITLILGPMYHLYTDEDKLAAMSEAIRVTKNGGIVFAAYCNNDTAQADSGLAGAFGFFHNGEYLRPSGLQFKTLLGAGDGERNAASRSGRFRQQMGAKRRKKRGIKQKAVLSKIYGKNSSKPGDFRSERKKRKIQKPAWLLDFSMAESVGFEPTCPCGQPHFEFYHRLSIT